MKETNMEHYRGEIEEAGYRFGIADGKIVDCHEISCNTCGFRRPKCVSGRIKWLMSEYKPEPVLTAREKHFVECLEDGWLTKGSTCNEFKWWGTKPRREGEKWVSDEGSTIHRILSYAFGIKLPFITHEDEEPWSVEGLRKLKALEYNPEDVAFKKGGSDENSQPTAYDIDKVVEQLEKIITDEADLFATEEINYDSKGNLIIRSTTDLHSYALRCLDKAIEIVKGGEV